MQNKFHTNATKSLNSFPKLGKYSIEGQQHLIVEPSGNELDLINEYNIDLIAQDRERKWPIGFVAQIIVLFSRNWVLTSRSQFTKLNCGQALCLSLIFGLFWLRMELSENRLHDRESFVFFMMVF